MFAGFLGVACLFIIGGYAIKEAVLLLLGGACLMISGAVGFTLTTGNDVFWAVGFLCVFGGITIIAGGTIIGKEEKKKRIVITDEYEKTCNEISNMRRSKRRRQSR